MIKFGTLVIEGFCSIPHYEIDLYTNHITIIRGENGYGKTTILSAILWALYGITAKEDAKDVNTWAKFRPKHYKGTKVSLYWNKDGQINQVIRCSNWTEKIEGSKGGSRLIYLIDGQEPKDKKKISIQALIEESLGMSYTLFKNSIMFGQGVKRLVQESGQDKKKLFDEVFELGYLSNAKMVAQKKRDVHQAQLKELEAKISNLQDVYISNKETYLEMKDTERSFKSDQLSKLKDLNLKYKLNNEELKKVKLDPSLLAKSLDKKAVLESGYSKLLAKYETNKKELDKILTPEGLNKLIDDIIKKVFSDPEKTIEALHSLKDSISAVTTFSSAKLKYREAISNITLNINKLKSEENKADAIRASLKALKSEIENINTKGPIILSPKYKQKFKEAKKSIDVMSEASKPLVKLVEDYTWVINDPLGNNGIKAYIFESSLESLNNTLRRYSDILGLRIEFGVDLSTARKDFYTLIEIGGTIVPYAELSGGQKQLVNIAMAFAMQESTTESKGISIMFLDEVFESLSRTNIEVVVELIKHISKNKSIFIITHQESLPIGNAKTLKLDFKNGLTVFN